MATVTDTRGVVWETGVIFDGVHGWHNDFRVYRLARDNGMPESNYGDDALMAAYDDGTGNLFDAEVAHDIVNDAIDWLNGLMPETHTFEFFDGDFYLWNSEGMID